MSLNLSIKPRRNRGRGLLWLLAAVVVGLGFIGWQRGLWPPKVQANLSRAGNGPALPAAPGETALARPAPAEVILASAQVVDHSSNEAYTAELYTAEDAEIPWDNAGGRTALQIYTVQDGDTLWSIAARFELDIDSLRWANPALERNPDVLAVGDELRILPVVGVYHVAQAGDTVESVAAQYGVADTGITGYPPNALYPPYQLTPGQGLIVPYGNKNPALPPPAPAAEFPLAWPVSGAVTQFFTPEHPALDLGAPYGSTVYAADSGTVTFAGWLAEGYGYSVIIDHGDGRETWYNHLKGTLLPAGGYVERGTPIAEVGSTGHSSGPHVHFELHLNGERVNPLDSMPAGPQ